MLDELFAEEIDCTLVYFWQFSILLPVDLLTSLQVTFISGLLLLLLMVRLVELKVEVVNRAAKLMSIKAFGA